MIFKIDYEHIFFDRYSLSEAEKKKEAFAILERVFKGVVVDSENCTVELYADCAEEELKLNDNIRMLKREFFLLLKMVEEEKKEVVAEAVDVIDIAEKYIRENYTYEALCAAKVCDYCSISRKRLDNGFEARFKKSTSEYIKALRVEKAAELIALGKNMDRVSYLCGFGSVKTMQRAFKSICGKTPSAYRSGRLDSKETK